MSTNQPIFIKNDAPRTVEVTPGSLNAKGKHNLVKPGEESPIHHHEGDVTHTELKSLVKLAGDNTPQAQAEGAENIQELSASHQIRLPLTSSSLEQSKGITQDHADHRNLLAPQDLTTDKNEQAVFDGSMVGQNGQPIEDLAITHENVQIDSSYATGHHEKIHHDEGTQNTIQLPQDSIRSQPISIEQNDVTHKNHQIIDQEKEDSNVQHLSQQIQEANNLSVEKESVTNNDQFIGNDHGLPNQQRISGQDSSENRVVLEKSQVTDNHQKLDDQKIDSNHIEIQTQSQALNRVAIGQENTVDHKQTINQGLQLSNAHLIASDDADGLELLKSRTTKGLKRQISGEELKKLQLDLMAKKKKAEDFHGRVEAIRKSVKVVNARLEKIENSNGGQHS